MTVVRSLAGVNPAILVWARERSGKSLPEVARAMGKSVGVEVLREWERGESSPSYPQLEKLAYAVYRRPLALFFFPDPPEEVDPRKSFRTLPDAEIESLAPDTRFQIRRARAMQFSFAELTDGRNPAPRQVLRDLEGMEHAISIALAANVRDYLGIDLDLQRTWRSTDAALAAWREAVEGAGVVVIKDLFKQKEISGFSLFDAEFPLICINNGTSKTRQIFSLFHELGHLLAHTGGVAKRDDRFISQLRGESQQIEVFCNAFAAQVLVPEDDFSAQNLGPDDGNITRLGRRYRVSREVILRRLLERGIVSAAAYEEKSRQWRNDYFEKRRESDGGSYYATQAAYLSDAFARTAFRKYYDGAISLDDLARHLNVKTTSVAGVEQAILQKAG